MNRRALLLPLLLTACGLSERPYAERRQGPLLVQRPITIPARAGAPVENAVIVFSASSRLRLGHVAVVTNIVSTREIRVDQANWQNHGEIDHATPVLDVSPKNDWSQVRVWDMRSQTFGSHVYAISGFIAKSLVQKAEND